LFRIKGVKRELRLDPILVGLLTKRFLIHKGEPNYLGEIEGFEGFTKILGSPFCKILFPICLGEFKT